MEEGKEKLGETRRSVFEKRHGRPLYFSQQEARSWVNRDEAEWLGAGEKRIRLTPKGQRRFLEMKGTCRLRGRSTVLGEAVVLSNEPWARAFEHHQLKPYRPSISNFGRSRKEMVNT
jgi:hypothetical protein